MKILILDDDEYRHEAYDLVYGNHEVVHTYTYTSFVDQLMRGSPFDLIHLDHDLGELIAGCDTYEDDYGRILQYNGQHAAWKICALDTDKLPKQVIIQSVNPPGAAAMKSIVLQRGIPVTWEPFTTPFSYNMSL